MMNNGLQSIPENPVSNGAITIHDPSCSSECVVVVVPEELLASELQVLDCEHQLFPRNGDIPCHILHPVSNCWRPENSKTIACSLKISKFK